MSTYPAHWPVIVSDKFSNRLKECLVFVTDKYWDIYTDCVLHEYSLFEDIQEEACEEAYLAIEVCLIIFMYILIKPYTLF